MQWSAPLSSTAATTHAPTCLRSTLRAPIPPRYPARLCSDALASRHVAGSPVQDLGEQRAGRNRLGLPWRFSHGPPSASGAGGLMRSRCSSSWSFLFHRSSLRLYVKPAIGLAPMKQRAMPDAHVRHNRRVKAERSGALCTSALMALLGMSCLHSIAKLG